MNTVRNIHVYPRTFCGESSYYFNATGPYTFVSVNRRYNEARAHTAMHGSAPHYSVDLRIYKRIRNRFCQYLENSPQNIRGYTDIFFAVYATVAKLTLTLVSALSTEQHVNIYRKWIFVLITSISRCASLGVSQNCSILIILTDALADHPSTETNSTATRSLFVIIATPRNASQVWQLKVISD